MTLPCSPAFWNIAHVSGCSTRLTPPTKARLERGREGHGIYFRWNPWAGIMQTTRDWIMPLSSRENKPYKIPADYLVWPKCNPNAAPWQATSEEEQAVSTVTAGPLRPKVNERRPLATDSVAPRNVGISMNEV